MTEFLVGGACVLGGSLAVGALVAFVAYRFLLLGREQGRDMQYHEDLHAGGVGVLEYEEPEDVEPETEVEPEPEPVVEPTPFRVTVVDRGSAPRHALRPDVWIAPENVEETLWPSANTEEPGTERLPAVAQ